MSPKPVLHKVMAVLMGYDSVINSPENITGDSCQESTLFPWPILLQILQKFF